MLIAHLIHNSATCDPHPCLAVACWTKILWTLRYEQVKFTVLTGYCMTLNKSTLNKNILNKIILNKSTLKTLIWPKNAYPYKKTAHPYKKLLTLILRLGEWLPPGCGPSIAVQQVRRLLCALSENVFILITSQMDQLKMRLLCALSSRKVFWEFCHFDHFPDGSIAVQQVRRLLCDLSFGKEWEFFIITHKCYSFGKECCHFDNFPDWSGQVESSRNLSLLL